LPHHQLSSWIPSESRLVWRSSGWPWNGHACQSPRRSSLHQVCSS
jgi:hypothetical protein